MMMAKGAKKVGYRRRIDKCRMEPVQVREDLQELFVAIDELVSFYH